MLSSNTLLSNSRATWPNNNKKVCKTNSNDKKITTGLQPSSAATVCNINSDIKWWNHQLQHRVMWWEAALLFSRWTLQHSNKHTMSDGEWTNSPLKWCATANCISLTHQCFNERKCNPLSCLDLDQPEPDPGIWWRWNQLLNAAHHAFSCNLATDKEIIRYHGNDT